MRWQFLEQYATAPDPEQRPLMQYLCAVEPARPWEVLAITFTNKAANELKDRLAARCWGRRPRTSGPPHSTLPASGFCVGTSTSIGFDTELYHLRYRRQPSVSSRTFSRRWDLEEKTFPAREVLSVIIALPRTP